MNRRDLLTTACRAAPSILLPTGTGQPTKPANPYLGSPEQRDSLKQTGDAIRGAFARDDVPGILAYHHDVIKALSYQNYLNGIDALRLDLLATLQSVNLEFTDNQVENTLFQGEIAVEESLFAIKITPKSGGASSVFKGRSMVVYVRYAPSPTGWASIREVVQPAS
jgi:hypothetical protein